MLEKEKIDFRYREYTKDPLGEEEIKEILGKLGLRANEVLRRRDAAFKGLGLTGSEPEEELISRMASNPTLIQRPIGVSGSLAVVGRPPERLLELSSR